MIRRVKRLFIKNETNEWPNDVQNIDQIQSSTEWLHPKEPFVFIGKQYSHYVYQKALVTVVLQGGLGNRMFQVAAAMWYANRYNKTCVIALNHSLYNPHSSLDYNQIFFTGIPLIDEFPTTYKRIQEEEHCFSTFVPYAHYEGHILLSGYFQSHQYIPNDFCSVLSFSTHIRNSNMRSFLHVRRGDFLNDALHNVDKSWYFRECLRRVEKRMDVIIISDDIEWCKQENVFFGCAFDTSSKNEIEALTLMKQCTDVAICSNSTFSFWGAYLSTCRNVYLPTPWLQNCTWGTDLLFDNHRVTVLQADIWPFDVYLFQQPVRTHDMIPQSHISVFDTITKGLQDFLDKGLKMGILVLTPCSVQSNHIKYIRQFMNEQIPFEILFLGHRGNARTQFIKSNSTFVCKSIEQPIACLVLRETVKKLKQSLDWNQFRHKYTLKNSVFI